MASTFMTALYSLANFGRLWPETAALALADYVSIEVLLIFAYVWVVFYQYFFRHYVIPLDHKEVKEYNFCKRKIKIFSFGFYHHALEEAIAEPKEE